jgi:L-rhamnose isomerase
VLCCAFRNAKLDGLEKKFVTLSGRIVAFDSEERTAMDARKREKIFEALESFRIELTSWGFANTGTRFGKFVQPAAANEDLRGISH